MYYNIKHQHRQLSILILLKNALVCLLHSSVNLILKYLALCRLLHLFFSSLKGLSQFILVIVPLLLLCCSFNTQALSATTAQVINGSVPYLTFDNGVTKVTTTDALLGITLSDGTRITPATNTSATTPIVLPNADETLANVQMLVPITSDSIALNDLIGAPKNYWGDDDGDGQGANGVTATGNLNVSITDKLNQAVSRSASLDICQAPYKVVLTSTAGSLTTKYGVPNSSAFTASSTTYYISPKATPVICYARPNLEYSNDKYAGPVNIWNITKGFLVQSTDSSSYSRNFPTTGGNNLFFDLDIGGIDASALTWPAVTHGDITATITPTSSQPNNIRVTLTGPAATASQISSDSPDSLTTPSLPQQFELVGYDSSQTKVLSYGFVLRQWFVHRGDKQTSISNQSSWCTNLGGGYRLPQVKDLTNAVGGSWTGGTPPSTTGNYYNRNIGAGLFTEWGRMRNYTAAGFVFDNYWSSDSNGSNQFFVNSNSGYVGSYLPSHNYYGVCTYP